MDVNLIVEQDGRRDVSVTASDWETMPGPDLLRRLLLHRDDAEETCADEWFQKVAANLRDIRDERGQRA